jgi:hypothetical protein
VAAVSLKGDKTLTELVEHFGVHPTQITDWKPPWLAQAVDVCGGTTGLSVGMKSRVQRGRHQLRDMLEACCVIALDRRRGVTDYDLWDQQDHSCRDRPHCS